MCNPAAVGLVFTIGSSIYSAQSQSQAADYNAAIQRRNAQMSDRAAQDAEQRGRVEADRRRDLAQRQLGQQRAAAAASGIDLASGTALDIQEGTAEIGEIDALTIENNAAREAYGIRVGASNARAGASLSETQGSNAATSTILGGAASGFNTAARFDLFGGGASPAGSSPGSGSLATAGGVGGATPRI